MRRKKCKVPKAGVNTVKASKLRDLSIFYDKIRATTIEEILRLETILNTHIQRNLLCKSKVSQFNAEKIENNNGANSKLVWFWIGGSQSEAWKRAIRAEKCMDEF